MTYNPSRTKERRFTTPRMGRKRTAADEMLMRVMLWELSVHMAVNLKHVEGEWHLWVTMTIVYEIFTFRWKLNNNIINDKINDT